MNDLNKPTHDHIEELADEALSMIKETQECVSEKFNNIKDGLLIQCECGKNYSHYLINRLGDYRCAFNEKIRRNPSRSIAFIAGFGALSWFSDGQQMSIQSNMLLQ